MVRNYVRRDVETQTESLTNKLPELVSKLVLSIPVLILLLYWRLQTLHNKLRSCAHEARGGIHFGIEGTLLAFSYSSVSANVRTMFMREC